MLIVIKYNVLVEKKRIYFCSILFYKIHVNNIIENLRFPQNMMKLFEFILFVALNLLYLSELYRCVEQLKLVIGIRTSNSVVL